MTTLTGLIARDPLHRVGRTEAWRRFYWVTWRQHRTVFTCAIAMIVLTATAMGLTEPALHRRMTGSAQFPVSGFFNEMGLTLEFLLMLTPVLAGLFLGAPLLASEAEFGTAQFAWTQGVSRRTWFVAQVLPVAVLLALAATGLGLEFRWWSEIPLARRPEWYAWPFSINPLPLAGWVVLGFSLGVFVGGAIRQLVPAMAVTFAGYVTIFLAAASWRQVYLPPVYRSASEVSVSSSGGYAFGTFAGEDPISSRLGWPDGRPLSNADYQRPTAWLAAHHIKVWITYQPISRFGLFELIEFGWLIAASAVLIGAALFLTQARAATHAGTWMTGLTAAVVRRPRPAPARAGLTWPIWRLPRLTILVMLIGFAACALWLGIAGLQAHAAYGDYVRAGCLSHYVNACEPAQARLRDLTWLGEVLPWLIGVFVGAPLIAREFETGSYRFAATQGISARRQTAAKLLLIGAIVAIASCLLGLLSTWSVTPLNRTFAEGSAPNWWPGNFSVTAMILPALALLDFGLGAALGALIKRAVPAMAATTAAVLLVTALITGFSVTGYGRSGYGPLGRAFLAVHLAPARAEVPRLWPVARTQPIDLSHIEWPVHLQPGQVAEAHYFSSGPGSDGSWQVTDWFTGPGGKRMSGAAAQAMLDRIPPAIATARPRLRAWLSDRGFTYWISEQPASRYWPLQAILAAILTALSVALGLAAVRLSQPRRGRHKLNLPHIR